MGAPYSNFNNKDKYYLKNKTFFDKINNSYHSNLDFANLEKQKNERKQNIESYSINKIKEYFIKLGFEFNKADSEKNGGARQ